MFEKYECSSTIMNALLQLFNPIVLLVSFKEQGVNFNKTIKVKSTKKLSTISTRDYKSAT